MLEISDEQNRPRTTTKNPCIQCLTAETLNMVNIYTWSILVASIGRKARPGEEIRKGGRERGPMCVELLTSHRVATEPSLMIWYLSVSLQWGSKLCRLLMRDILGGMTHKGKCCKTGVCYHFWGIAANRKYSRIWDQRRDWRMGMLHRTLRSLQELWIELWDGKLVESFEQRSYIRWLIS